MLSSDWDPDLETASEGDIDVETCFSHPLIVGLEELSEEPLPPACSSCSWFG